MKTDPVVVRGLASLLASILLFVMAPGVRADLESDFANPSRATRPWVYWFIMDGNLSKEGITADLESMEKAGIGGAILMEVDVGIPRGSVEFMSPAWRALFKHAVLEAQRLGLQLALNAGPGWTGSGGPWVKPEQSMQHLVASRTSIQGPRHVDELLPQAKPRTPFFGEGGLSPDLTQAKNAFYRDEAVLAFPTPDGGSTIQDFEEKALYYRAPYSSQPNVRPYFLMPGTYATNSSSQVVGLSGIVDLSKQLSADGRLVWDAPPGNWTVMRFGRTSTGQNTRPAPVPGLGLECDKFDPVALDAHFEAFIGALLKELGTSRNGKRDSGWTMLHIDSWEMSSQNWTAAFRHEFQSRRGYDPLPYLPTLTGLVVVDREHSERFLWDLRKTASELVVENHAGHLKKLAHERGFGLSIEPYDMNPAGDLSLGAVADVPMCEFWATGHGFETSHTSFEAVSVAHVQGCPIVASESFTSDDSERWKMYPGALKGQADWALCAGINRIVFHRFQHQPWLDRAPGMTMGPYGVHWERTQTWWEFVPAFHKYLARCQTLLRQGLPVADICYLAPEGAPHVFRAPKGGTIGSPPDRPGHNFDGCPPEVFIEKARVREHKIVFPGGMSYRLLVLPNQETMTPGLVTKIRQLVEAGAHVVGRPPIKSPSLSGYPGCDEVVLQESKRLWGSTEVPTAMTVRTVGKGTIAWGGEACPPVAENSAYPEYAVAAARLQALNVADDFQSDAGLRYTHRDLGSKQLYFVSNPNPKELPAARAVFRVSGMGAELWDPATGKRHSLKGKSVGKDRTELGLQFEPHQSFFIVFRKAGGGSAGLDEPEPLLTACSPAATLQGPWEVSFDPKRGAPEKVSLSKLTDWTLSADDGVKHYSGIATYRTRFDWPDSPSSSGKKVIIGGGKERVWLDLGEMRVMADVRLNGQDLGVVWTPPMRVDITRALVRGMNELEVRVANLWPNRLIGDAGVPEDKRVSWTSWSPFKPGDALLPSGWLGPARIMTSPR